MPTAREELARALYLLRAGTDPQTFMETVRAYVVHESTPQQIGELCKMLLAVQPELTREYMGAAPERHIAVANELATLAADMRRLSAQLPKKKTASPRKAGRRVRAKPRATARAPRKELRH